MLWDCGAEAGGGERHSEANNGLASGNLRRRETRRQNKGRDCSIFCLMYLCSASHVESAIVERGEKASMDKSRDQRIGARARWSRTSGTKVAILACKVNWGTVMRMQS